MQFGETDGNERMSRPFGVSLLMAGIDKSGGGNQPLLYHTDPSGTYLRCVRCKTLQFRTKSARV